jgi:hypothetical protein
MVIVTTSNVASSPVITPRIIDSDAAEPLLWLAHFDPLVTSPGLGKLPDTL